MLYYENLFIYLYRQQMFLYKQTHPPTKGITHFIYSPNFFSKIFKPLVYIVCETPTSCNPTHDLEDWGSPPIIIINK